MCSPPFSTDFAERITCFGIFFAQRICPNCRPTCWGRSACRMLLSQQSTRYCHYSSVVQTNKLYTSQSILRSQLLACNLIPIILFISLLYRMLPHTNAHQCIKDQCCQRIQTLEEPNVFWTAENSTPTLRFQVVKCQHGIQNRVQIWFLCFW